MSSIVIIGSLARLLIPCRIRRNGWNLFNLEIQLGNTPGYLEGLILGDLMKVDKQLDGSITDKKAFSCLFAPSANSLAYG
jgi:hypothetical protein